MCAHVIWISLYCNPLGYRLYAVGNSVHAVAYRVYAVGYKVHAVECVCCGLQDIC